MIEVKGLGFAYHGQKGKALKDLSFNIGQGEIFGFLGPSGAGKSTTQKILIGALKAYEGEVFVLGRELRQMGREYYERIGVAFEFPNFYNRLTALENLKLFRALYSRPAEDPMELLAKVGLTNHAQMKVGAYSKGMKMRLNLCRALLGNPDVLFLDEPTSGLDPVNAQVLKEIILAKKAEGKTIMLTTHNMSAAEELCDKVAFIIDGSIVLVDSPAALKISRGRRRLHLSYRETDGRISHCRFELKGLGDNANFLQLLRTKRVETMHTEEATLEQIFIEVTGRGLS
ncbi:ABC transporter ATP-binding protein [Paenibacillus tarimensis]